MPKNKRQTILIIEDDPWVIQPLKVFLQSYKLNVLVADNAEDGVASAGKNAPDIILLDIMMPKTDGFSALATLKANAVTENIPVFIVSNLSSDHDIERGMKLGAKRFFIKTQVSLKEVVRAVKEELGIK